MVMRCINVFTITAPQDAHKKLMLQVNWLELFRAQCYIDTYLNHLHIFLILTAVDCDSLTDPTNGQITLTAGTTLGQNATYSCNTGYNLVGESTRTCQASGNWSESAPTCEGM